MPDIDDTYDTDYDDWEESPDEGDYYGDFDPALVPWEELGLSPGSLPEDSDSWTWDDFWDWADIPEDDERGYGDAEGG